MLSAGILLPAVPLMGDGEGATTPTPELYVPETRSWKERRRRRRGRKCALPLLLPLLLLHPLRLLAPSTRSLPRHLWEMYPSTCLDDEMTGLCKHKADRVVLSVNVNCNILCRVCLCQACLYIERVLPPHALLFDVVFTTIMHVLLDLWFSA